MNIDENPWKSGPKRGSERPQEQLNALDGWTFTTAAVSQVDEAVRKQKANAGAPNSARKGLEKGSKSMDFGAKTRFTSSWSVSRAST